MAFGKFSLFWLVVVLCLMSVIKSNGIRQERSYSEEEEEDENDPFIFKKERGWKRVDAEAGHIRVIPFFRERSSRTASPLHNYELNSIEMDPNSLLIPHYITADLYMYAYEGKGTIGWVHNQKLIEQDLEAGQIYHVPKGSLLYLINRDKNQRLHMYTLLLNENQLIHLHRQHEAFFVAGGQNPETLFSGFSRETLAAAFGTENEELEKVLRKQDRGAIVSMGKEQGKEQKTDDLLVWPWSSSKKHEGAAEKKPFDLQKKKPDFSNDNGQYMKADGKSFSPLKRQDIAITLTKIQQGKMTAPHWHDHAHAISMVLRGRGRVEIVRPESADSRQRGRESEREREREREREEEQGREREREEEKEMERERGHESERGRESYRRVEAELNEGDGFLVPAGYPSVQISNSEESFEILTFLINNEHNDINFLTGKNSAMREIKDEVLAVSMDEKEQEVKKVMEAQKDERFLRGPKESQRISSII